MELIVAVIFSYLVGSIPTAYLLGKWSKGIDIREHGSGNVGASNTFRVLGKWPGIFVLAVDILKGVAAILIIGHIFGVRSAFGFVVLGVAVVCGHNWTIFLSFKGGKGIATSLGVLTGMTIVFPGLLPVLLTAVFIWGITFIFLRYISVASMTAAVALPFLVFFFNQAPEFVLMGAVFCVFVIYRHRSNIVRIANKTEPKVVMPFFKSK